MIYEDEYGNLFNSDFRRADSNSVFESILTKLFQFSILGLFIYIIAVII